MSAPGIPPVIPFERFKLAAEALGITAEGVYRIEIDTKCVRVHRLLKDEGRTLTVGDPWSKHGATLVRALDEIPLSRVAESETA